MKWFTEKEFKCRCCGELPAEVQGNVKALVANVLDPAREKFVLCACEGIKESGSVLVNRIEVYFERLI